RLRKSFDQVVDTETATQILNCIMPVIAEAAQKGQRDAPQALSERAEETPLCANHAQIWYTMRNTLKPKSGCVACDAESGFTRLRTCIQKLKELPREDVEQVILDHHGVGRHYKWKTPFVRADALDAILKECAL